MIRAAVRLGRFHTSLSTQIPLSFPSFKATFFFLHLPQNSCLSFCCIVTIMCVWKNLCCCNEPFSLQGGLKSDRIQKNKQRCVMTHWAAPASIKPPSRSCLACFSSSVIPASPSRGSGVYLPANRRCRSGCEQVCAFNKANRKLETARGRSTDRLARGRFGLSGCQKGFRKVFNRAESEARIKTLW